MTVNCKPGSVTALSCWVSSRSRSDLTPHCHSPVWGPAISPPPPRSFFSSQSNPPPESQRTCTFNWMVRCCHISYLETDTKKLQTTDLKIVVSCHCQPVLGLLINIQGFFVFVFYYGQSLRLQRPNYPNYGPVF